MCGVFVALFVQVAGVFEQGELNSAEGDVTSDSGSVALIECEWTILGYGTDGLYG